MDDIVLTRTLVGQGFDDRDLGRMRGTAPCFGCVAARMNGSDLRNGREPTSIES